MTYRLGDKNGADDAMGGPDESARAMQPHPMLLARKRKPKLADLVAQRIQHQIAEVGWPIGQLIGNEAQLMKTHGVSRETLREAVRQLERHGVAVMRRGASGGLVVLKSARQSAVQALATYLELTDVSLDELFEARGILEVKAVELAIQRLSDADIEALRRDMRLLEETRADELSQEVRLHLGIRRAISAATRNPALSVFLESLNRVTGALLPDMERLSGLRAGRLKMREARRALVEAVIAGNLLAAEHAVQVELGESYRAAKRNLERFKREAGKKNAVESGAAPQVADWDSNQKLPHRLAVAIAREVARQPPGTRVGSEPDLLARFGCSRAVLREAVGVLEGYGIVSMRRGFGGGLVVGTPDPTHTVTLAGEYLSHTNLSLSHFFEVLQTLEIAVAPLAAIRAPIEKVQELRDALTEVAHANRRTMLHRLQTNSLALQLSAGNRAISLIGLVIDQRAPSYAFELPPKNVLYALLKYQQELLDAVAAHDAGLARRKATRMLMAADLWWGSKLRKEWLSRL